jgi:hypothetical protein
MIFVYLFVSAIPKILYLTNGFDDVTNMRIRLRVYLANKDSPNKSLIVIIPQDRDINTGQEALFPKIKCSIQYYLIIFNPKSSIAWKSLSKVYKVAPLLITVEAIMMSVLLIFLPFFSKLSSSLAAC